MEFGKHLEKGIWSFADKGLSVLYGVAYLVLVIRVLPQEEFGNFTLLQELFLIISGLATAFALQPMLKYAVEEETNQKAVLSSALLMNIGFLLVFSLLVVVLRSPLSKILNSPGLEPLFLYLPVMLAASFIRNFALVLLQTRFLVKQIFVVDAMHFMGTPALIYLYSKLHIFDSAFDLVTISIISLSASSLVGLVVCRSMLHFDFRVSAAEMRKMWDYGKYSFGGLVSYMVYAKSDTFILASFGGAIPVAVYTAAKTFTRVFEMVSQVVQMFVLPATSKLSSKRDRTMLKIVVEKALAFSTLGMIPAFLGFVLLASPLVSILYQGRYADAIPLLQIFSLLSFIVPATAVSANTLMGLGHARLSFVLGIQVLFASVCIYLAFIPWLGALGATIGYVLSSFFMAWIIIAKMNKYVPISFMELLRRTDDVKMFIKKRLART